jgi:hypothetical protein
MTVSETVEDYLVETVDSIELPALLHQVRLEPRCRICRSDDVRKKVNDMLAGGLSYSMILRALEEDNAKLDKRDRVSIDSIRNHTTRHYPVQNVAKATYRAILELRAKENGVDFVNGVATAITPMAFYETVMAKGYETLTDSGTKVDVPTGMIAAARLQALIDSRATGTTMVELRVEIGRVINAVKSTVPESMWGEITRKLDRSVETGEPSVDEETDVFDPADESFEDDDLDELVN